MHVARGRRNPVFTNGCWCRASSSCDVCGAGRQAAENADGAAYADAVSEYAALVQDELRAAALKLLTGPTPATSGRG
ncbi:hypothetical protein J7E87_08865 [Streptomyces sp. ISL-1]|uniref:hypothetical protein n=1 Tax=Streptomyces sp. ISL-1 TaxID=2817657 RepID=UPI001BE8AE85|nr:hypothetical protein [Streptomyces sp. ISL-1]MBT2389540.1 hypothetical protein [Streptomyces sp. ISL-1]